MADVMRRWSGARFRAGSRWILPYHQPNPILPLRGMRRIAWEITNEFGLTLAELRGRGRSGFLCNARFEAFARCRALGYSTPEIGRFFNRDHTSVMYGLRKKGCR